MGTIQYIYIGLSPALQFQCSLIINDDICLQLYIHECRGGRKHMTKYGSSERACPVRSISTFVCVQLYAFSVMPLLTHTSYVVLNFKCQTEARGGEGGGSITEMKVPFPTRGCGLKVVFALCASPRQMFWGRWWFSRLCNAEQLSRLQLLLCPQYWDVQSV